MRRISKSDIASLFTFNQPKKHVNGTHSSYNYCELWVIKTVRLKWFGHFCLSSHKPSFILLPCGLTQMH